MELIKPTSIDFAQLYYEAELVAQRVHRDQPYDIFPYIKHLKDVVDILKFYGFSGAHIIAGWLHDSIEDGSLTYNKIKAAFGTEVAEIVLAVTDPIDVRNREEKKKIVYQKLNLYPKAKVVKLSDRLANWKHSIRMNNVSKINMYRDEHVNFKNSIYDHNEELECFWIELDQIYKIISK